MNDMKLFITRYLLLFPGMVLLLVSCDSFLDKQESEDLTFDQIWNKRSYTYGYFLNAMGFLPNDIDDYVNAPWVASSDEAVTVSSVAGEAMNTGSWNASSVPFNKMGEFYKGIRECNIFMQNIDRCTDPLVTVEDKANWYWYTRWARAYYYFMMMRNYGPVFLLGDELIDFNSTTEQLYRPRNTWEQCVKYVTDEMTACAKYFKSNNQTTWQTDNDKGLPTAGAALAVISRLKLYSARDLFNGNTLYRDVRNPVTPDFSDLSGVNLFPQAYDSGKWKEALDAAQAVIDLGVYELYRTGDNNPYGNYIGITQKHWNNEIIWSTGYATLGILARRCAPSGLAGIAYGAIGPTQQQVDAYAMANGKYPIIGYNNDGTPVKDESSGYTEEGQSTFTNPFQDWLGSNLAANQRYSSRKWPNMYKNREPRFYITVYWSDSYWKHGTAPSNYTLCSLARGGNSNSSHDHSRSGYLLYRYYDHRLNSTAGQWGYMVFPTFRLGEIYLNYIEAALEWEKRSGEKLYHDKAMILWKDLRERSGMREITEVYPQAKSNIDQLIELCRKERRIELAFENHRFFDTRTWKIATVTDNGPIYGMNIDAKASGVTNTPESFWHRTVMQSRIFKDNHYLYPFTQRELDRNKLLQQNYGW